MNDTHIGRTFTGTRLEDGCPCGKAPCGLVDSNRIDPECFQHGVTHAQTLRQIFPADTCPRCAALKQANA